MTSPYELINARETTHGDFRDNGRVMQGIKDLLRSGPSWVHMTPFEREGVDMIAHKLGRIVCGDPSWLDHWDDIAGYATRVATILRERPEPASEPLGEPGSFIQRLDF